jgi:hypothetical protein
MPIFNDVVLASPTPAMILISTHRQQTASCIRWALLEEKGDWLRPAVVINLEVLREMVWGF